MRRRRFSLPLLLVLGAFLTSVSPAAHAQATETVLYSFCQQPSSTPGECYDGQQPTFEPLIEASDGNFYGTTAGGGVFGKGTVFQLTPSGTLTTIWDFCSVTGGSGCIDGKTPIGGLVEGVDGNLYGTTEYGGMSTNCQTIGCGTVFQITMGGSLTTLYQFCMQAGCPDGYNPSGLVPASDGNLYGTTSYGADAAGNFGSGTIYKIALNGTLTTLYSFCTQATACNVGVGSGVIQGSDGNFYGINETNCGGDSTDCGIVFQYQPGGKLTILYNYLNYTGNAFPLNQLVEGNDGNYYGTTDEGGTGPGFPGTAFNITTSGTLTELYNFCSNFSDNECLDGGAPVGLFLGSDGNFYGGTTQGGEGKAGDPNGYYQDSGTFFQLAPDGTLTTLYNFCNLAACADGAIAWNSVMQGHDGAFYGMTYTGGANYYGAIYKMVVPGKFAAPVQLGLSPTTVAANSPVAVEWQVNNAFSDTMQQCNAYVQGGVSGAGVWTGKQTGTLSGKIFSGTGTITPTKAGTYTYALTCGGMESGFATLTVTNGTTKSNTTTTLTASPTSAVVGQTVTLTATVAKTSGSGTPTGTVTFLVDGAQEGQPVTLNSSGVAQLTLAVGASGTYALTANYSGDASDNSSTGTDSIVLTNANTSTTLTASPTTAAVGQTVTLTATVARTAGTGTPTGSVTFLVDGVQDGQPVALNSSGVATLALSAGAAGTFALKANYGGDSGDNKSTGTGSIVLSDANTTTTLAVSNTALTVGETETLTATVARTAGSGAPTGKVTFYADGTAISPAESVNSGGVATFSANTNGYPPASYTLTAKYAGDSGDNASTSTAKTVTLSKAQTSTVLTLSTLYPTVGERVTLTAAVTRAAGSGYATGVVTFYEGGTHVLGTVTLNKGVATVTAIANYPPDTYNLTASYAGDKEDVASTSANDVVRLSKAPTTTVLTVSPTTVTPPGSGTITVTVTRPSGSSGLPTGMVKLWVGQVGGYYLGSGTLSARGNPAVATVTYSQSSRGVPAGQYPLVAEYGGDGGDEASTSTTVLVTVQ
jgi:uncharacterized repeat protein (TIGR03803 family)